MFNKLFWQNKNYKIASFFLVLSFIITSGCKMAQRPSSSAETQNAPLAPPAPVVVDGVRTSYADVVEKTSPAVVRIEAEVGVCPTVSNRWRYISRTSLRTTASNCLPLTSNDVAALEIILDDPILCRLNSSPRDSLLMYANGKTANCRTQTR